jgi:putative copper export protein
MLDALAAAVKALLYAGVLSCAGAVFAEASLRGALGAAVHFPAQVMRRAGLVTIVAALVGALILIFRLGGQFDEPTLSAVFLSSSGAAMSFQLAGPILILVAMGADKTDRAMRLLDAALATVSFAICGHAASAGGLEGAAAFVHVSAAAWWVGSLCVLRYACAHLELVAVAGLVQRFSSIVMRLIGALLIAGLILIAALVDFARHPLLTPYGQILVVKLGIVVLVLGLASYNKFRLTPRLRSGDRTAVASLQRMINAELVAIGAILATTAILTTYTSPLE